ncbi:MAG: hydroxyacid dehydrogenase [Ktedonobacteraceae bacterium]|nr:hydroxyacid dehydrogenase [Ktedonobacteraceae bacterium]
MQRLKGLYVLRTDAYDKIYGPEERSDIAELVDIYAEQQTEESLRERPELLAEADVIFSGWGMVPLDEALLKHAPRLSMVFYGAGSVRYFVTDALWERGIRICSSYAANAVPVSEYTLAAILFSLKHGWRFASTVRQLRHYPERRHMPGAYGSTVGIVSLGMVGRLVCERLRPFDLNVIAYDPFVSAEEAREMGVRLVSLEELFASADVVSLHTPLLDSTRGMIGRQYFSSMKPWSTFINTSRGAIVHEEEMIAVLQQRPDLQAVLDVTNPEPPAAESALYTLPNVIVTPHIAGSQGDECRRMGRLMVDELRRYLAGEALRWEISRERAEMLA